MELIHADRLSYEEWVQHGKKSIVERATARMETIILIRPNPITGSKGTLVTSSVVPNSDGGTGMCPYLTP